MQAEISAVYVKHKFLQSAYHICKKLYSVRLFANHMNVRPRPEAGSQPDLNRHFFFVLFAFIFVHTKKTQLKIAYRKIMHFNLVLFVLVVYLFFNLRKYKKYKTKKKVQW